jgi:hypothetical protein
VLAVMINRNARTTVARHGVPRVHNSETIRANPGVNTSSSTWADTLTVPKPDNIFRFIFHNIQGLPVHPRAHKHQQIGDAFTETEADVFGLVELNLNFRVLDASSQWFERFRHLKRNHSIHSSNQHDSSDSKVLFGGSAQIALGPSSHRVLESGADPSGLGRWVWTLFAGRNNTKLRVLSGYRPNPDSSDSTGSVYSQHERYLRSIKDDRNPRRAFIKDLQKALIAWSTEGNLFLIGLDANDNVRTGDVTAMLRNLGLIDVHHTQHPHLPPVATCHKNHQNIPVDGIWASPSLDCVAAGYYGFGELLMGKSDHRMIWADFSYESILGFQPPKPVYTPPQRLTLDDPRVVKKYNKILLREHRRLKLDTRAFALQAALPNGLQPHHLKEYETLANLDLNARRHASKNCRKLRMGAVLYSDDIRKARGAVDMWDLLQRKRDGIRASTRKIRRLMKLTNERTAFSVPEYEIATKRKAAMKHYKHLKKGHMKLREKFGKRLMQARAKELKTTYEAQEKLLKQAFGQRALAQRVKRITGTPRNTMRCVNAPVHANGEGDRRDCFDRNDIEVACMAEGTRRFSQTQSTPLMQPTFVSRVGYHAELSGADDILAGTFVPDPDFDPYAAQFIAQLQMNPEVRDQTLSKAITTQSYQESWKRMRPNTSCSPSGPSFVDYIAGSRDNHIAAFDTTMANIPYAGGYTPKAWTQMTDVLIPKKSHSSLVEKLRIIVLFHAMFNMNNKRIGREMVANAERLGQIPWEVYGGRKRHRAIECATNKVLTMDIARLEHRPMALCSNDAKSCYDRILHAVASICMRRVGVPQETCAMMFGTLAQVDHYVRTNFGDSTTTYACIEIPFQGVYQGNGAGPGIWLLVSIPIINMLKARGFGFTVTNAMTREHFAFVCYAFVDDTDLVHAPKEDLGVCNLVHEMQDVIDTWEGGLRASGGALVPSKSYWYLLNFSFRNNQWHYDSIDDTPGSLTIRDVSGFNRVQLDRLEVSAARETLGVFIAMDGNQDTQVQALLQKTNLWADKVRSGRLTPTEAWFSLTFCMMKTLEYPLMATSLSHEQCYTIMRPLLQAGLPVLGLNRHLTRSVVYGPRRFQGVGIPDLWVLQGILKLWLALAHGDAPTITGCSLRAALSLHMIELGLPGYMFQQDFTQFGHLATHSWLTNLWIFCDESNLQLHPSTPSLQLARDNDSFLMTQFYQYGYRKTDLFHLNLCRLWCHAVRLSDITTGDGRRIHPICWVGYHHDDAGHDFVWPVHGRPTKKCWTLWQTAIRACYLTLQQPQQILRRPLGKWHTALPPTWTWTYSPSQNRVFHRLSSSEGFETYSAIATRRVMRSPKYLRTDMCSHLPADAERTTVFSQPTFVWCHGSMPSNDIHSSIACVKDQIHQRDHWAVQSLDCPGHGIDIARALIQGNAIAICDGSYKDHFGTAGFVLQRWDQQQRRILGANVTPGHASDQNPYRSEIGGIFAIVVVVEALVALYDIKEGAIEVACDCESGLIAIFDHHYDTPGQPHHDLIHEIRRKIASSPITWNHRHVRGHQDKHVPFHLLDMWGQLNVEMDSLAKAFWNEHSSTTQPVYPPNTSGWSIWTDNRKLSTWDRNQLYDHAQSTDILQHWSERRHLPPQLIRSIDWEASENAIKRLGLNKSLWIPKWLAGFAPVGKVLKRYNLQTHDECPRCTEPETTAHVLRCPAPRAVAIWNASIAMLNRWLIKAMTMPDLRLAILQRLRAWKNLDAYCPPSYAWPGVNALVSTQDLLGWRAFLEGCVLQEWARMQQEYYTWLDKKNTGRRWVTTLIKLLWQISWDMWEHRKGELNSPSSPAFLREHARLDAQIAPEFDDIRSLMRKDRRWFKRPKEVLYTETLEYKLQWLESVALARARYHRRHRHDLTAERAAMRHYLCRHPDRTPCNLPD